MTHLLRTRRSTFDFSDQEDILVHIISLLDVSEIRLMRLVSKRVRMLVNTKLIWLNCLTRLDLPLPPTITDSPLSALPQTALEGLAARAVRLDANWRSENPRLATAARSIPLDSTVTAMAMCHGTLFTAHKDGTLRYWHDLESPLSHREEVQRREDLRRSVVITPDVRITSFTQLGVSRDSSPTGGFIVAYVGDSLDRRTHGGVFFVPAFTSRNSTPQSLATFDECKGSVGLSVSSKRVIVARNTGVLTVIDLESGDKYTAAQIPVTPSHACQGLDAARLLRLHTISDNAFLVITTHSALIYQTPPLEMHVGAPSPIYVYDFPDAKCAAAWVQSVPATLASPQQHTVTTLLTQDSRILRFALAQNKETGEWNVIQAQPQDSNCNFPYEVDRLSLTEMVGGPKRSVWVHWERGVDGWPLHVVAGSCSPSATTTSPPSQGEGLTDSILAPSKLDFRLLAINSPDDELESPINTGELAEVVDTCTRSVSMPKICFDEGMGRMVLAGTASPSLVLCDF